MQNAGSILDRLRRVIPPGVEPKFKSAAELMAWQREEGLKRAAEVDKLNQQARAEKIFGRSGIQNLHRSCSFANYTVNGDGQRHALSMAKSYAQNFGTGFASFVFTGKPGTGKNHLAYAIAKSVIAEHQSPVVFTTALKIAREFKSTWSKTATRSEEDVIRFFTKPDLLIIDEVGIQFGSEAEKMIMFEIINTRYERLKPTILISNLPKDELTQFIGERVIDRMNDGGGCTISFTWDSYRENRS